MAAGPLTVRCHQPMGKRHLETFTTLSFKLNVVTLNVQTLEVTFGNVNYAPWVKKWYRWELLDLFESMSAGRICSKLWAFTDSKLMEDPDYFTRVADLKKDTKLCREPDWPSLC